MARAHRETGRRLIEYCRYSSSVGGPGVVGRKGRRRCCLVIRVADQDHSSVDLVHTARFGLCWRCRQACRGCNPERQIAVSSRSPSPSLLPDPLHRSLSSGCMAHLHLGDHAPPPPLASPHMMAHIDHSFHSRLTKGTAEFRRPRGRTLLHRWERSTSLDGLETAEWVRLPDKTRSDEVPADSLAGTTTILEMAVEARFQAEHRTLATPCGKTGTLPLEAAGTPPEQARWIEWAG